MRRELYHNLIEWKKNTRRKPLLLQGARQVGKTWLIEHFGKKEYTNYIYVNFEETPEAKSIFSADLIPQKIIENIGLWKNIKINKTDTLIFFDEIQLCPEAITSLKYFQEKAPEYHVIAAGSLLGVSLGKSTGFPVGKVNFLTLYPLSFKEFLMALNEDLLVERLTLHQTEKSIPEIVHTKLIDYFKMYLFLGGMPEVIRDYIENKDIKGARQIQLEILKSYHRDFSKYANPFEALKIAAIWDSVPSQLAKENKKFKFSLIHDKARSNTYELAIEWLKKAGLLYLVYQLKVAKFPLAGYADLSKFKIFSLDTGLLGAMLNISSEIIIKPDSLFTEYNGAFIENYVCSELKRMTEEEIYYWTSDREAEVDFIIHYQDEIVPIEVKSGLSKDLKSLRIFEEKFKSKRIIRISPRIFVKHDSFINIPLYGIMGLKSILEHKNG